MGKQLPEHIAFDNDNPEHHGAIGTCDFPMDEAINRLDGTPPPVAQPMELAAHGLSEILHWVWQPEKRRRPQLQAACRRFIALSMTLRPELLCGLGYREVGALSGCTKAALSKLAILFSRQFGGLQFRRQHGGRDNMRKAALGNHNRARKAP